MWGTGVVTHVLNRTPGWFSRHRTFHCDLFSHTLLPGVRWLDTPDFFLPSLVTESFPVPLIEPKRPGQIEDNSTLMDPIRPCTRVPTCRSFPGSTIDFLQTPWTSVCLPFHLSSVWCRTFPTYDEIGRRAVGGWDDKMEKSRRGPWGFRQGSE